MPRSLDRSKQVVHAADAVLPVLKVDFAKAFQVDEVDRIPLRSLAAKASHWRDAQSRFDEWRRLAAADARLRALSATTLADAWRPAQFRPTRRTLCSIARTPKSVWSQAVAATPASA